MTILVVALLGAGILFVASSLDNKPIIDTFQKILRGEKIDWTGGSSSPDKNTGVDILPDTGSVVQLPDANGNCPKGMIKVTDPIGFNDICIPWGPSTSNPGVPTSPPVWIKQDANGNCPSNYTPIGNLCHLN